MIDIFFMTAIGIGVIVFGVYMARRPKRAEVHAEYMLHGDSDDALKFSDLIARLTGRNLVVVALGEDGRAGREPLPADAPLVGTQAQLKLAGSSGPVGVLLRLRREAGRGVFGLIEIDDDTSHIHRRLGAEIVRALDTLMPGLTYSYLGSTTRQIAVADLGPGEEL